MQRFKRNNKIYRKYEDFFTTDDLKDPDTPQRINLTIEDFDAKGQVANPRAPCVVTTIEPYYTKDAALQRRANKFRMKTDILRLREITRKKFVIYATQQRYLEKQRETTYQEHVYKRITEFQEFAAVALSKMESSAFQDMRQAQKQLSDLQKVKINEELKGIAADHQRFLMEVQEVFARFLFLLKLISYFDEIISPEDIEDRQQECKLSQSVDIVKLQINERNPVDQNEVSHIITYMDNVVRPYLAKRNHLNADIWIKLLFSTYIHRSDVVISLLQRNQGNQLIWYICFISHETSDNVSLSNKSRLLVKTKNNIFYQGYERTRQKIFNYNRKFTQVALLNHLVSVVRDKSKKTFAIRTHRPLFLMDAKFLTNRIEFLMQSSLKILNDFERRQKNDKMQLKLNAIVPVILQRIEVKMSQPNEDEIKSPLPKTTDKTKRDNVKKSITADTFNATSSTELYDNRDGDTLTKVEKLQWYLLSLLQHLEKYPPHVCKQIETQVRQRLDMQKDCSHCALIKQNRLHNWMHHYKKHEVLRQKK